MTPEKTLVLLTAAYPFGNLWEAFLEDELRVLSERFDQVILLPSSTDTTVREVPSNVRCETVLADIDRQRIAIALLRHPIAAAHQFARAVIEERAPGAYLGHPVPYLGVIGLHLCKRQALERFVIGEGLQDALFYDYWLTNAGLALSWLRRRGLIRRAVARAHGYDLYDEQSARGSVEFRAFIVSSLDRIFPVSANGLSYLADKYPRARSRPTLSHLGIESPPSAPASGPRHAVGAGDGAGDPLIVTCGAFLPIKRIQAVPELLARIGLPLRWVHFGDGPMRSEVEEEARKLPTHVSWHLAGHVPRREILDFYANNEVAMLVSLSRSEGVPVSMMEAISYGIPVLATSVGGVADVVNPSTGRLVSLEDPPELVAQEARMLLNGHRPSRDETIAFFAANFAAEKNFPEFADQLLALLPEPA